MAFACFGVGNLLEIGWINQRKLLRTESPRSAFRAFRCCDNRSPLRGFLGTEMCMCFDLIIFLKPASVGSAYCIYFFQ